MDPASAATGIRIDRLDRLNLGPVKVVPRPGLAIAAAVRKFRRSTATLRGSSSSRPLEPPRPVTPISVVGGIGASANAPHSARAGRHTL